MKTLDQMPANTTASQQTSAGNNNTGEIRLTSVSKIGQLDCIVKSQVYRELFSRQGKNDVISVINVIDIDDKTKYKLICSTFLERELLRFGVGILNRKIRIINRGKPAGKNYFAIEVTDLSAPTAVPPAAVSQSAVTDEDITF